MATHLEGPWTGPVFITTCTNSTTRELTGMQVWYGYYDPVVGMCHGDLSTTCRRDALGQVSEIELFWSLNGGPNLHGMRIKQKSLHNNFFNSYSGTVIEAGIVDNSGDLRSNVTYFSDVERFFGFKTTTVDDEITRLEVVNFDQESFASSKLQAQVEFAASQQANSDWHGQVAMILANWNIGRLPVPSSLANVAGVYRPEQLRIDEAEVRQLLAEFAEDKAVAEANDAIRLQDWNEVQAADNIYYKDYVEAERVATLA